MTSVIYSKSNQATAKNASLRNSLLLLIIFKKIATRIYLENTISQRVFTEHGQFAPDLTLMHCFKNTVPQRRVIGFLKIKKVLLSVVALVQTHLLAVCNNTWASSVLRILRKPSCLSLRMLFVSRKCWNLLFNIVSNNLHVQLVKAMGR